MAPQMWDAYWAGQPQTTDYVSPDSQFSRQYTPPEGPFGQAPLGPSLQRVLGGEDPRQVAIERFKAAIMGDQQGPASEVVRVGLEAPPPLEQVQGAGQGLPPMSDDDFAAMMQPPAPEQMQPGQTGVYGPGSAQISQPLRTEPPQAPPPMTDDELLAAMAMQDINRDVLGPIPK